MRVNYLGVVHTLKATVAAMVARQCGHIAVTNSIGGFMGESKRSSNFILSGSHLSTELDASPGHTLGDQVAIEQMRIICMITADSVRDHYLALVNLYSMPDEAHVPLA